MDPAHPLGYDHVFDRGNPPGERNTWLVLVLTAAMMVVEIAAGWLFHSMALLADGWHMGTDLASLGITASSYWLARRYARDPRFAFGAFKIEVLGGYTSAIVLAIVSLFMAVESLLRLFQPLEIRYDAALFVAVAGLIVNVASAWLLSGHHQHGIVVDGDSHDHHHHDESGLARGHGDWNLRAAYLHMLADTTISVLAIVALLGGKLWGLAWLDPLMGFVGSSAVGWWSVSLIRGTSRVLLDREMDHSIVAEIREILTSDGQTQIVDLHVWRVGRASFAGIVSLVSPQPRPLEEYKRLLASHKELAHVTIEISQPEQPSLLS